MNRGRMFVRLRVSQAAPVIVAASSQREETRPSPGVAQRLTSGGIPDRYAHSSLSARDCHGTNLTALREPALATLRSLALWR